MGISLYSKINSCVLVDSWFSEAFQVRRGIRQGCPLSARLFVLATETLTVNIKQDQTVKGIKVGYELEVEIVQLADDTTVMVGDETSVVLIQYVKLVMYAGILIMRKQRDYG